MDPRHLPPIPTPPAQRWREVRLVYLPRVMFALGVALVAWMWTGTVAPATMVAEAESVTADVRATQAGMVVGLKVALNQTVRAGDVVGHLAAANPRLLDAALAVIRADVAMLSATMAGATDRQRISLDLERLQLEWMSQRVSRAALQGQLQQTEADLTRTEPLNRAGLIPAENFEQLKITRVSLLAQLEEKNKLIARLEPALGKFNAADPQANGLAGDAGLAAAIKVQEAKLRLAEEQMAPLPLLAPIDGVVSHISRRAGEAVVAGDVVLRLTVAKPERLTGYLRQPLPVEPKAGMKAEIRTRGTPAKVATTTITEVGVALELINPTVIAAMRLPSTPAPETALRVQLALPAGLALLPGEHVDVLLK